MTEPVDDIEFIVAPPLRPEMRAMFIELVDQLVPENERELFGEAGHPGKEIVPRS
jgi:hypothetical protein